MNSYICKSIPIHGSPATIADFFGDVRNFKKIMPEQIENWRADKNSCSFRIKNLGELAFQKGKFNVPHQFEFQSTDQSKVNFMLVFHLFDNKTFPPNGHFEILTEVSPLIEMMVKRPLNNFVAILTTNLAEIFIEK